MEVKNRKPKAVNYQTRLQIRVSQELQDYLNETALALHRDSSKIAREGIEMYLNALNEKYQIKED